MCDEDRDWFKDLLKDCIQGFDCSFSDVVPCQPVLYGDFMNPGADTKVYTVIEDKEKVGTGRPLASSWRFASFHLTGLSALTHLLIPSLLHAVV